MSATHLHETLELIRDKCEWAKLHAVSRSWMAEAIEEIRSLAEEAMVEALDLALVLDETGED